MFTLMNIISQLIQSALPRLPSLVNQQAKTDERRAGGGLIRAIRICLEMREKITSGNASVLLLYHHRE